MRLMIDLETMDDSPSAAIVQIGAVFFDDQHLLDEFSVNVDLASAMRAGGTAGAGTIHWWLAQSEEARLALRNPPPVDLNSAVAAFFRFCGYQNFDNAWSHGSSFDLVILDQTVRRIGKRLPWGFYQIRDTRTLFAMVDPSVMTDINEKASRIWSTRHVAVEDAKRQAWTVLKAEEAIRLGQLRTVEEASDD